jgi:uncharacterized protein YbjT (DUF2867 family)
MFSRSSLQIQDQLAESSSNSGIGFETARALAASGAHIIGLARTLEDTQRACARASGSTTSVACDLADLASVDAAVKAVRGIGRSLSSPTLASPTCRLCESGMA